MTEVETSEVPGREARPVDEAYDVAPFGHEVVGDHARLPAGDDHPTTDDWPVTPAGRGVAAFLMLAGIALFGVLTANLAAFLLERVPEDAPAEDPVQEKLDELLRRVSRHGEGLGGPTMMEARLASVMRLSDGAECEALHRNRV